MPLFIPITKVNVAQRLVHGTLSEEIPDKSGEILDYETSKPAFMEWSRQFHEASGGRSLGNVRAMHGPVAAGKLTDIAFDDNNRRIEGVARIVDEDAWQKVLEGVYTGFSIGGGYAKRWPDPENPALMRYTPTLSEVSLVDNPAVPTATFSVVKVDGSTELRHFAREVKKTGWDESALLEALQWFLKQEHEEKVLSYAQALVDFLTGTDNTKNSEVEKMNHVNARVAMLHKQVDILAKRIADLEAMPAAARGVLRAVQKSDDYDVHLPATDNAQHAVTRIHDLRDAVQNLMVRG